MITHFDYNLSIVPLFVNSDVDTTKGSSIYFILHNESIINDSVNRYLQRSHIYPAASLTFTLSRLSLWPIIFISDLLLDLFLSDRNLLLFLH